MFDSSPRRQTTKETSSACSLPRVAGANPQIAGDLLDFPLTTSPKRSL